MKKTLTELTKEGWYKVGEYGLNCEIYKRGEHRLIWNRETHHIQ